MTKDEALNIENSDFNKCTKQELFEYIIELRKALEQPCQECENLKHDLASYMKMVHDYANQNPLSDDEILNIKDNLSKKWRLTLSGGLPMDDYVNTNIEFARAIEKAHKIGVEND